MATKPPAKRPPTFSSHGVLHPNLDRRLAAYMDAACQHIPKWFQPNCCLGATRLAIEVLGKRFRMRVKPMVCAAWVMNPQAAILYQVSGAVPESGTPEERQWLDAGAALVVVGAGDAPPQTNGWDNHLIALVEDRIILDVTLGQAARPGRGINAHPLLTTAGENCLAEGGDGFELMGGGLVAYRFKPDDVSYRHAKDWLRVKDYQPLVSVLAGETNRNFAARADAES
jgi:hypothetical protein